MTALTRVFCLLCLLGTLTGCTQSPPPAPAEPELPPLPEIQWSDGYSVTVSGTELPGGSLVTDGVTYVDLKELTDALGVPLHPQPLVMALSFPWQEQGVSVTANHTSIRIGSQTAELSAPPLLWEDALLVPLISMAEALQISVYEDKELQHLYLTPEAAPRQIPAGYHVPVLMYHGVSDVPWGITELFVSPADLEAQLAYLQENGFTTIHFSDLFQADTIEKPVILTFDDGYADNYTELFPLLQKYNAKATIFVVTGALGVNPNFMTWEQARQMQDSGLVSIQSHTVSHPELWSLSADGQRAELEQSKLDIVRNLGTEPYVLCYPTGYYNADTLQIMEGLYTMGVKINGNDYYTDHSPLEINRWYVPRYTSLYTFGDMVQ